MQATSPLPFSETDEHALEQALRQATLEELAREARRVRLQSRQAVAAHLAACQRMAQAIQEARARLLLARSSVAGACEQQTPESVNMASQTFHKSPHLQASLPQLPPSGEP